MKSLERLTTVDLVGRALVTWARACVGGRTFLQYVHGGGRGMSKQEGRQLKRERAKARTQTWILALVLFLSCLVPYIRPPFQGSPQHLVWQLDWETPVDPKKTNELEQHNYCLLLNSETEEVSLNNPGNCLSNQIVWRLRLILSHVWNYANDFYI